MSSRTRNVVTVNRAGLFRWIFWRGSAAWGDGGLVVLACLLGLLGVRSAWAQESALWVEFKEAKAAGQVPELPDFSYAGYDYSESPIPDTSGWRVFNVTDYGAVADDGEYDDTAIRATIDAAEAAPGGGGRVVFFPPGRFMVSPNETVGENIFVRASNMLLKGSGAGAGGTEIFKDKMKVNNGRYMFEIAPADLEEQALTTVVKKAERETYEIEVADASGLVVGQRILISADGVEFATAYFTPQKIHPDWARLHDPERGFVLRETHSISAIDGNTVRLREPLHITLYTDAAEVLVKSYNVITNVGVEDILFKGNWDSYPEEFVHHKDKIHDYAWNALRLDNVVNGWVRNCEFRDWNQCVYLDGCAAITIDRIKMTGKKGHMSTHTRRSYGVLIKDCVDTAGHHHGCGVGYWNSGAVYLRHRMNGEQRLDCHSGTPYATLFDGVTGGHLSGNGGGYVSYPHHGKYFVAWNYTVSGGPTEYDFWPSERNAHTFAMPYLVGLQGKPIKLKPGTYAANESPGRAVEPESLFEAQLEFRLRSGPSE